MDNEEECQGEPHFNIMNEAPTDHSAACFKAGDCAVSKP
jgi:hypothetical protein